ncbi:phage minor head protein [Methylobacter tundripaludum]|uniref:phage minor head protein n=1 Tax=Methylobacter tundripaludum TaxID=173365 RepID=UPI00068D4DBD|nr:phage minor head protein [Methylobacter tundripaludum]
MPLKLSPTQAAFNARGDGKFNLTFQEQVDFFRKKLNLPTEHYDDIIGAAHDRAFVVAGAAKADLLNDLRGAVDKAIAEGKSIQWFRKNFDGIVQQHGWEGWTGSDTKAGRDWRTRVIYRTNLSTSYAAGRYSQLTHPDLLQSRPYWKYIHNDTVSHPRPLHQSWSGTVLRYDDPFWQTHFPPNGWGCRCRIAAVPASDYHGHPAPDDGTYEKIDRNGEIHTLPKGVDYGWDYAPGASVVQQNGFIDAKAKSLPPKLGKAFKEDVGSIKPKPLEFVSTPNLAEAEDRIKAAGVGEVSLKGLKPAEFNAVVQAVEEESAFGGFSLDKLTTYRSSGSRAGALYSPSNNAISLNLSHVRTIENHKLMSYEEQLVDLENFAEDLRANYLGNVKYKQSTIMARLNSVNNRVYAIKQKIKANETARPWSTSSMYDTVPEVLKSRITHELGHFRHFKTVGEQVHFVFNKANSVSEYGRTNRNEYFAEWFASYRLRGTDGVPADLLALFERIKP